MLAPLRHPMTLFLDKIQTLACVGDLLVGLSQNLIASGVWTVMKRTLGVCPQLSSALLRNHV